MLISNLYSESVKQLPEWSYEGFSEKKSNTISWYVWEPIAREPYVFTQNQCDFRVQGIKLPYGTSFQPIREFDQISEKLMGYWLATHLTKEKSLTLAQQMLLFGACYVRLVWWASVIGMFRLSCSACRIFCGRKFKNSYLTPGHP